MYPDNPDASDRETAVSCSRRKYTGIGASAANVLTGHLRLGEPLYFNLMKTWEIDPFWKQVIVKFVGASAGIMTGSLTNTVGVV
ncbi:Mitochondrial Carrier (MC) protein [Phytophthora megakarya]|uniref:Mitochondrial Carrier (MC) protein n=1 Tax=Phytophthora megakarya TaxID=4795 RepID=A0A225W8F7_9STRA|nr:Mitochondrial Carrier (MC) protein [Phytophthora megakarya]